MHKCNNGDLFSFRFVSFCGSCVYVYICIHDVGRPYFLFSLHSPQSPYSLFSLAFRVAAREQSPFVMVVKPVLFYLIFVVCVAFLLPFPFSLSPVLSFHCNLLTWILSTLWPLPYLFFCHECSAHKFNEHVRTAWMPLFVPFSFPRVSLLQHCRCSASH